MCVLGGLPLIPRRGRISVMRRRQLVSTCGRYDCHVSKQCITTMVMRAAIDFKYVGSTTSLSGVIGTIEFKRTVFLLAWKRGYRRPEGDRLPRNKERCFTCKHPAGCGMKGTGQCGRGLIEVPYLNVGVNLPQITRGLCHYSLNKGAHRSSVQKEKQWYRYR